MSSRRTVLYTFATGATGVLAGCSAAVEGGPEGSADLILVNETQSPVTVTLAVTDESGGTLLSETFDVPVVEGHGRPNTPIEDVFETDGEYTISVAVRDGPSTTETLLVRATADDADMHQIYIENDGIEFS
ncbi:hypothetical protein [Halopiger aswanensis]|uniref:Uncharacterized protein n=1 Tax=Halopiger aswanensis TaxID=148449 RepID=A0A419WR95_9EURY|nr:hypothetical protein [Halopiger aswanensis]RKD97979.1 hypothetical protein ATJ93_0978 [Halopiger aswanensis]